MGEVQKFFTSPAVRALAKGTSLADIRRERDALERLVAESGPQRPHAGLSGPRDRLHDAVNSLVASEVGRAIEDVLLQTQLGITERTLYSLAAVGRLGDSGALAWPRGTALEARLAEPIYDASVTTVQALMETVTKCYEQPFRSFSEQEVLSALFAIVDRTRPKREPTAVARQRVMDAVPDVLRADLVAAQSTYAKRCELLESFNTDPECRAFARLPDRCSSLSYELFEEQIVAVSDGAVEAEKLEATRSRVDQYQDDGRSIERAIA